jgi:hypothetical protein
MKQSPSEVWRHLAYLADNFVDKLLYLIAVIRA